MAARRVGSGYSDESATEGDKLREAIHQCWLKLPTVALFGLFINLLFLASPIYLMQIFDRVIGSGHIETLVALTVIVAVALLAMGALDSIRMMMLNRAARWIERRMAPELIGASMRLALEGYPPTAQPLRDLATIKLFVGSTAVAAFGDVIWTPLFILAIWHVHPWFGMLGTAAVSLLVLLTLLSELATKRRLSTAALKGAQNAQRAENIIRNASSIHAMGMARNVVGYWEDRHREALEHMIRGNDRAVWFTGMTKAIRLLIQAAVLASGTYLILNADLTTGSMMACSIMLSRALVPIEQITGAWKHFVAARESYGRITGLLDVLPQERSTILLPPPSGRVVCEDVLFVPRRRVEAVLMGVSFSVEPGTAVGIVGPSAAGKSTLCKIIAGILRPTRGHVRLDGVDVFEWSPEQLGPHVGYVPQEPDLFEGNISRVIARMAPEPDPEAVIAAAKAAGAHEMILSLPEGYETELGDDRSALSGGQRQRVALARALYRKPRLLILDEPNTNLDGMGEAALNRAIEAAKAWGATVFIVAHQLSLLRAADQLLLLTGGKPVMFGTRDEVLTRLNAGSGSPRPQPAPARPVQGPRPAAPGPTPGRQQAAAKAGGPDKEPAVAADAPTHTLVDRQKIPVPVAYTTAAIRPASQPPGPAPADTQTPTHPTHGPLPAAASKVAENARL